MMAKERADLMPFVHQRLAQLELAPLGKGAGLAGPTLIVADLDDQVHGLGPLFGEDEDNQDLIEGEAREVARPELHAPAEPEPDQ